MKISELFKVKMDDTPICLGCNKPLPLVKFNFIYRFSCECDEGNVALHGALDDYVHTIYIITSKFRVNIYCRVFEVFTRLDSTKALYVGETKDILELSTQDITSDWVNVLLAFGDDY